MTEKFDIWAIVELFGHQKIVGRVSEQQIAGANMVRVSVPETTSIPAFDRFLNPSAIYAINPVTEEVARGYAERLHTRPIDSYDAREVLRRIDAAKQLSAAPKYDEAYEENQRAADEAVNYMDGDDDD
jgi:hypothetical protein